MEDQLMGWAAAYAFAEAKGIALDDALTMLHGQDPQPLRCPICGKRFALRRGVLDHAEAKHKDPEHIRRVATWWIESVSGTPNQKEIQS
jgi:hypothetical protein